MNKSSKINALVLALGFLISSLQGFAEDLTLLDYAEATFALARGPLAALSYRNHAEHTKIAKALHVTTDVVRITSELLSISRAQGKSHICSSLFWMGFDATNLAIDLFSKDKRTNDTLELSQEQQNKINQLVCITQTYLLPSLESLTALYQALNNDRSPKYCLYLRHAQALKSLARATSVYLNHQQSKAAILLLISAISETMYTLHEQYTFNAHEAETSNTQPLPQETLLDELGGTTESQGQQTDDDNNLNTPNAERERDALGHTEERRSHQREALRNRANLPPSLVHAPDGRGLLIPQSVVATQDLIQPPSDSILKRVAPFACGHLVLETYLTEGGNTCPTCDHFRILDSGRAHTEMPQPRPRATNPVVTRAQQPSAANPVVTPAQQDSAAEEQSRRLVRFNNSAFESLEVRQALWAEIQEYENSRRNQS